MERRDYLTKQYEQLGRILGRLLAKIIGIKTADSNSENTKKFHDELALGLGVRIEFMLEMSNEDFIQFLQKEKHFSITHFEMLSDIFFQLASLTDNDKIFKQQLLKKCIALLEHAQRHSDEYSIQRNERIELSIVENSKLNLE
ncbi:MAG: hypothetical protein HOP11_03065 [Saprospiraceae bacterium]|nr:hypothetical protein [Saprospiraceae bacterium]